MRERLSRTDRRNAILDAAADVFGARGFDATRMDDVARAAGVAKGLLYKHFPSKDALFEALVDRQSRVYAAELRGALESADASTDPEAATRRGVAVWLRQVARDPATFQLGDPGMHSAYDGLRDRMRSVVADAIAAVAPDGDPDVRALAAAAVQGAAESVAKQWTLRLDTVDEELALDVLAAFCWGGLAQVGARLGSGRESVTETAAVPRPERAG